MSVIVVGSSEPVGILAATLAGMGVEAEGHRVGANGGTPSGEGLAAALVEIEALVAERAPQAIVALGPGDASSAAALVAGKAGIRLISLLAAPGASADEARAVSVLSDRTLPLPLDGPAVEQVAREIAEALDPAAA